jgi:hypothetical protein
MLGSGSFDQALRVGKRAEPQYSLGGSDGQRDNTATSALAHDGINVITALSRQRLASAGRVRRNRRRCPSIERVR